ncbi:MAG: hypothetical protein PHX30_04315 [Candidatus Pacebacteria bacterium]|nr:hypothetical protein [Candidatus Paceibacterota bacterium]
MVVRKYFKIIGKKFVPIEENDGSRNIFAVIEVDNEDSMQFGVESPAEMGEFVIGKGRSFPKIGEQVMGVGSKYEPFYWREEVKIEEKEVFTEEFCKRDIEEIASIMGITHDVYQGDRRRRCCCK